MQKLWDAFSAEEKAAIEARFQELRADYMTLQEIRKHRHVTQEDMAKLLGIKQENVSRLERREDMRLSTLKEYIEALGGTMQISAVFPDNQVINILNGHEERRS
jgi:transcriptional regulator with XRE-family HTH domain